MSIPHVKRIKENNPQQAEPIVWVINSNATGELMARIGVAEKITSNYQIIDIPLEDRGGVVEYFKRKALLDRNFQWPDILIYSSSKEDVAGGLDTVSKGKTLIVQIGAPNINNHIRNPCLKVVSVDKLDNKQNRNKNVMPVIGVPHAVTQEKIENGKKEWENHFSVLPHPKIAVLLGGSTSKVEFSPEVAREMAQQIARKAKELGGSLIITTSRRTGKEATEAFVDEIHKEYDVPAYLHDWRLDAAKGDPYYGILGLADAIVVTGDSRSMCCEANKSKKPVYIYAPNNFSIETHTRLHQLLYANHLAKPFSEFMEKGIEHWDYEPLDTAGEIAIEALKRLRERQVSLPNH